MREFKYRGLEKEKYGFKQGDLLFGCLDIYKGVEY